MHWSSFHISRAHLAPIRWLEWLTRPAPAVADPEARVRARLLAATLLIMLIAGAIWVVPGIVLSVQAAPPDLQMTLTLLALAPLTALYGLSRTRHYRLAAALTIALILIDPPLQALINPDYVGTLYFSSLALLFSGILFPWRVTAGLTLALCGVLVAFIIALPRAVLADLTLSLAFSMTVGALVLAHTAIRHRDQQRIRQDAARLAASEARYRAASEGSMDAFLLLTVERGADGQIAHFIISDMNRHAEEFTNQPREALLQRRLYELPALHEVNRLCDQFAAALTTGQAVEDEIPLADSSAPRRWISYQIVPVGDGIALTLRDITRRKAGEDALVDLAAALESQKRLLETVMSATPLQFVIFDRQGRYVYANPAALKMVGTTAEAVLGKRPHELPLFAERKLVRFDRELDLLFSGQTEPISGTVQTTDGDEPRTYEYVLTPVQDADGSISAVISTIRDITERQHVEEERLELAVQRARVKTLQELIHDTSHDLKTPLSVLNTSLYLLRRFVSDPERREHHAEVLQAQVNYLARIIDDLVNRSDLEQPAAASPNPDQVDIHALLAAIIEELQPLLARKNQRLQYHPENNPLITAGDATRLRRALLNLITNAIKYTPEGGSITISTESLAGQMVISVADTGVGINPTDLPLVFERFYRAHNKDESGKGLGLAIAKSAIEAHGGSITVESTPGQGSIFRVYLPVLAGAGV